jgi:hypothetical protein
MESHNLEKSLHEHGLAVSLSPNSAFANWAFGYALLCCDRNQEALDRFDIALRLSPRDPLTWSYQVCFSISALAIRRGGHTGARGNHPPYGRRSMATCSSRDFTRPTWPIRYCGNRYL